MSVSIDGHREITSNRPGFTACACGSYTTLSWAEHVIQTIEAKVVTRTGVDVCEHCGDLVVRFYHDNWVHYRGPGSFLNRCQHTVPYGLNATPRNEGLYHSIGEE